MTRPLRVEFPGAVHYVGARGSANGPIFVDDGDRERFLAALASVVSRYSVLCYAYCLVDDQYHLLLETPEANLSETMRQLNGVYGRHFARRHCKRGPVLDGRFRSQIVEKKTSLLELARHVVLVPVRAGLVSDPSRWPWSSYRATAGEIRVPPFLSADGLLHAVGAATLQAAQRRYRSFVREGLAAGHDPLPRFERRPIVGSASFIASLEPRLHDSSLATQTPRTPRFASRPPIERLFREAGSDQRRNARICEAYHRHGYTMKQIANHLRLHDSTISRIVTAAEARSSSAPEPRDRRSIGRLAASQPPVSADR